MKSIGIIGAGIAGLTLAYRLLKKGVKVEVFEAEHEPGGLASSFNFNGLVIERYYHFICANDFHLINLVKDLRLQEKLKWNTAPMGFFHEGVSYPFASPIDLLGFTPIGIVDRIRFGFNILYSKNIKSWKRLEKISAKEWLQRHIGDKAYKVIWEPLIKVKFGPYADHISAAWIWHRIYRVAKSRQKKLGPNLMGYLEGGTATLVNSLVDNIENMGGIIHYDHPVKKLLGDKSRVTGIKTAGTYSQFDGVVSTVPIAQLVSLLQPDHEEYKKKLEDIKFIGVVCMVMKLEKSLSPYFWLNINDSRISFNGIIEYSNLNQNLKNQGINVAYIPFYLPVDEERFSYTEEQLFDEYTRCINHVTPGFEPGWVKDYKVFRNSFAQVICTTNFSEQVPDKQSPINGLYVTDSSQLYPEDRTISGTIATASEVADIIA